MESHEVFPGRLSIENSRQSSCSPSRAEQPAPSHVQRSQRPPIWKSDNCLVSSFYRFFKQVTLLTASLYRTWFNTSGNREMYMRCHKATIGGSGSDNGGFNALPNMFVAQLHTTTCKVPEGIEVNFPNPGPQVQGTGNGGPTGDCGSSGPSSPAPPLPPSGKAEQQTLAVVPPPPPPSSNGGSCQPGQTKCGGGSWSMCAHGEFVNMGSLAAGTDCSSIAKRSAIRFSAAHMAKRAV